MAARLVKVGVGLTVLLALVVLGGYAVVVAVQGHPPRWLRTTEVCAQATDVAYGDGSYAVFLAEPRLTLGLAEEPPRAVVSRAGDGSHGVALPLSEGTGTDDVTCAWDADGVTVTDELGISHRVPATVFTGGR